MNLGWKRDLLDEKRLYNFANANIKSADLIRTYMLEMNNVGNAYTRRIKTFTGALTDVGGLSKSLIAGIFFFDLVLGSPFRMLDLSLNFRLMQESLGPECFCDSAKQRT